MYPASFEYFAPETLDEAIGLLDKFGEEAKVMAGGQSLIPLLKLRLASFSYVVDISRIREMNYVERRKGYVEIGPLTTIGELEENELIKTEFRIIRDAAEQIADPLVRNRGTIGGNISHGDLSNDMPAVMIALKARFEITGVNGKRVVEADSFITDPFTTVLNAGEILSKILIPLPQLNSGGCYIKQKKNAGDFSIAAAAVQLVLDDDYKIISAGIGLTSVGPKPIRAIKAEHFIEGKKVNDSVAREVSKIVVSESSPSSDFYGSADFKRKTLEKIVEEAINVSYERAMVR